MRNLLAAVAVMMFLTVPGNAADSILSRIKESRVTATVLEAGALYADKTEKGGVAAVIAADAEVEIIKDYQYTWYYVRELSTDKKGWIKRENIEIPPDSPSEKSRLNDGELEAFANLMGYTSTTPYLTLVDIDRQLVYVFKGQKFHWKLARTMVCSSGKNESPTLRGEFTLIDRGLWFYSERLGSGGKFWVRFDDSYLFHSVAMDKKGGVIDGVLGERRSSGCVRLSVGDAEWFYKNIPDGSRVVIR